MTLLSHYTFADLKVVKQHYNHKQH